MGEGVGWNETLPKKKKKKCLNTTNYLFNTVLLFSKCPLIAPSEAIIFSINLLSPAKHCCLRAGGRLNSMHTLHLG